MRSNAPIGVFDSGIGGLTVVKELVELMPGEDFIYFGDTARIPYGPRPKEQIMEFMRQILDFFATQQVKMAVVACNTMTALGIEQARREYPFWLVGVNPGVDTALQLTRRKKVGVIATQATIASGKHVEAMGKRSREVIVYPQACPKLVPLIESEYLSGAEIEGAVREYVMPLRQAGVDAIILACTHYPYVMPLIQQVAGNDAAIINPARETALDAYNLLKQQNMLTTDTAPGKVRLCFSADLEPARKLAAHVLDIDRMEFCQVNVQK